MEETTGEGQGRGMDGGVIPGIDIGMGRSRIEEVGKRRYGGGGGIATPLHVMTLLRDVLVRVRPRGGGVAIPHRDGAPARTHHLHEGVFVTRVRQGKGVTPHLQDGVVVMKLHPEGTVMTRHPGGIVMIRHPEEADAMKVAIIGGNGQVHERSMTEGGEKRL